MRNRGLATPSIQEMVDKYQVNIPGKVEVIWQPLYDFQAAAVAATQEQIFFQVPQGQAGKTLADTNMVLAGQIPSGQMFAITGVEVYFYPADLISQADAVSAYADDLNNVYKSGALQMTIGSKPYIQQAPLQSFPPTVYVEGFSAVSTTVAATTRADLFAANKGREYAVRDLALVSTQNFDVRILNRAAISAIGRIGVKLNGFLFRNAQ